MAVEMVDTVALVAGIVVVADTIVAEVVMAVATAAVDIVGLGLVVVASCILLST